MIKSTFFTKLLLFLIILPALSFGQQLDYPLGEVLIHLKKEISIDQFSSSLQTNSAHFFNKSKINPVAKELAIWKISFDPNLFDERHVLNTLRADPLLENAQYNFYIKNRNTPDDPQFGEQWHWYNSGQSGGPAGIDLDAGLAWGITTGGVSILGDTIVLCIIDESFDLQHEDLAPNLWVNSQEIPNDGIDNDENGYIDDYQGWNVDFENDQVGSTGASEWHGTAVAGISGAKGDNATGITGLCWDIKLMLVSRGNTTADAVAAYNYPLRNRQLYNQTNGQRGAFVVGTNASWGIDFGMASDAPIWCSVYDSLGHAGILNAAATSNMNIDVDEFGDLPTTCSSDFLITTTTVDRFDIKMENAGYGAQSIDLASFGDEILSTSVNDAYGPISGTSAAAPQLAGAIGLFHTIQCPSFANLAKYEPQQAALLLKNYLLDGVDPNASLANITLSGGRLNVFNSMQLLLADCNYAGCFPPYAIEVSEIGQETVFVNWISDNPDNVLNLEYRESGNTLWNVFNSIEAPFLLENIHPCTSYEFRLESECDDSNSAYSEIFTFMTDGCCDAPSQFNFSAEANNINIAWNAITAAEAYLLAYRPSGTLPWNEQLLVGNNFSVPNLLECTDYDFRVKTICPNEESTFSAIQMHSTLGCDVCTEFDYCATSGAPGGFTWINQVNVADLSHSSATNTQAYSDFTDQSANLTRGFVHEVAISTDYNALQFSGIFSIWIDFNQNGIFEGVELAFQSNGPEVSTSGTIFIPPSALLGSTRMRVALHEDYYDPCGMSSLFGEVEDYCVFISEPTECLPPANIQAEANNNSVNLSWLGNILIDEYIINYQENGTSDWQSSTVTSSNLIIYDLTPCTSYDFFLTSVCDGETSSASPILSFTTKGCGTCLDEDYCEVIPGNVSFEWIETVSFNDLYNNSGSNNGYVHFTDYTTSVIPGGTYTFTLEPGFSNDFFNENFYVWIDYNRDGVYNDVTEKVMQSTSTNGDIIIQEVQIPLNAQTGATRMKIAMKYIDPIYNPCEGGFFGEIEEYCINILEESTDVCPEAFISYTEALDEHNILMTWDSVDDAVSYRLRYRAIDSLHLPWCYLTTPNTSALAINLESCIDYSLQIQTICAEGMGSFGLSTIMNTCSYVSTENIEASAITDPKLSVYPNPFSENLTLQYTATEDQAIETEIYSGFGQLIRRDKFDVLKGDNYFDYSLSDQPSGIYILNIIIDGQSYSSQKIIYQTP